MPTASRRRPRAAAPAPIDLNPRDDPPLDFPDRLFGELRPGDYRALGFLCGLEVHQQLATAGKLFCRCPAGRRVTRVDAEVLRHMRPTLSEMGEYDGCALMEFKTDKEIVYLLERGSVCTYELDDTPPFEIDEDAVRTALAIARLFDLNLISELHVMRKQYLDGSIPTGFQRTAMVGLGGAIPFRESELGSGRELRIRQLSLEEDSCREVSDVGHRITFRTDRLGVPLIETVTEPDLLTPLDVAAGGRLLAEVARASGRVRRGPGAARQDVNVSIAGSRRVELKGVWTHRVLPRLVHNEAYRHLNLLRIRAELARRGLAAGLCDLAEDGLPWERSELCADVTALLAGCDHLPIRRALEQRARICAVKLPGFRGLLAHDTQPGIPFRRELEERVRVIACLTGWPFMVTSDDGGGDGDGVLGQTIWQAVRTALRADSGDAVAVLWGPERDLATAVREVLARCREAFDGVPSETRQAFADATTGFERILPGPQRMYPDTDTPPLAIPDAWVDEIERRPVERPWQRADRYEQLGLRPRMARQLAIAPCAVLFDELFAAPSDPPPQTARRIAGAFLRRLPRRPRADQTAELPDAARIRPLCDAIDRGAIDPSGTCFVLDRLLGEGDRPAEAIVAEHCQSAEDPMLLERALVATIERGRTMPFKNPDAALRWAMGQVMRVLPRGRVSPELARRRLVQALAPVEDAT